jgi:glycosyltransferase involved in cell wall biosynthesis
MTSIVGLIPARDEARRIAHTVRAVRSLVDEVVVVDDGSKDATAAEALGAGATVLRIRSRAGKGRAVDGALGRLPAADVWLLADGDLGETAVGLHLLLDEVSDGRAQLAIAVFPRQVGGGFGIVKGFAANAIHRLSGFHPREPLSGQRAITRECLDVVRPLAGGFGMETAMTIDAVRGGFRVVEVPIDDLSHRPTGRGVRGFIHRGRQGWDILRAVAIRAVTRRAARKR